jgi:hypothetical protein
MERRGRIASPLLTLVDVALEQNHANGVFDTQSREGLGGLRRLLWV